MSAQKVDVLNLIDAEHDLLQALWIATEHNAMHFGENHNTVIMGRAAIEKARRVLPWLPFAGKQKGGEV